MYGNDLSERKKLILKAVVESHIEYGEPVGSKSLQQLPGISCSSATIRNEMAELEEMGYLEQPHTSAGRVPSQLGYRFYVDQLIEHYAMTAGEINQINSILKSKTEELDQILLAASKLASSLTNYTGLAVKPKRNSVSVTRFEIAYIDNCNFVLIMVTSLGNVVSKHIRLSEARPRERIELLCEALNRFVAGVAAEAINVHLIMELEAVMQNDAALVSPILKTIYSALSEYDGGELQFSGINRLLHYSDYESNDQLSELLGTLEQKDEILKLVSESNGDDISVLIGSESSVKVMNNSALVFKPIVRDGKTVGVIGVLGPLRMDYARVLETIERVCGSVEEIIGAYTPISAPNPALPPSDKASNDLRKGKNDTDE